MTDGLSLAVAAKPVLTGPRWAFMRARRGSPSGLSLPDPRKALHPAGC